MQTFTVSVECDFPHAAEVIFDAWTDPEMRAKFETPEGSGMALTKTDMRVGGTEEVTINAGDQEVGKIISEIQILQRPNLMVVQARGIFDGQTTMTMQNTFEITPDGGGCILKGTSQMVVTGDEPTPRDVEEGWADMLDRFDMALEERDAT